jgi:hypothetical protein
MTLGNDIELFDDYLNNVLDQQARDAFEQKMAADENFRRSFEDYQAAVRVVKAAGAAQHIKSLMTAGQGKTVGLTRNMGWLSIAASLVLLMVFFLWPFGKQSHEKLFNKYYQPYPNILALRSESASMMKAAMEQYSSGNYAKAIDLMKDIAVKSDTLHFYSGVSSLYHGNSNDAVLSLSKVGENSVFYPQVIWYQGLAYLCNNDHENAKRMFSRIRPSEYKYEEAQSILASL